MRLFKGKKIAEGILAELRERIKAENMKPKLAVILIGEDEASKIYIRLKKEATEAIGAEFKLCKYAADTEENEIIKKIKELNSDKSVNGIIVQLPLPEKFNRDRIISVIDPQKDVDGFHKENRQLFSEGRQRFEPVLPSAILAAIRDALGNDVSGKKAVALVNSDIFGEILKVVFKKENIDFRYKLRKTCSISGVESDLKETDIIITVCGCPNLVRGEMIKQGAILIDAGIFRAKNGKVVGDVDRESVEGIASYLTPVPGGIGPLVIALLLQNILAATLQIYR